MGGTIQRRIRRGAMGGTVGSMTEKDGHCEGRGPCKQKDLQCPSRGGVLPILEVNLEAVKFFLWRRRFILTY